MRPTIGSLCSGYGGLDRAVEEFFGAETAWFAEYDEAPSKILAHHWPGVPNYGDMTAIDWASVPKVDIITGGTPCQDLSAAGRRKGMTEGTRSNLWVQMRECIAAVRPSVVVWENVRGAYSAYAVSEVENEDVDEWAGFGQMEPGSGLLGEPYGPGRPALRALHRVLGDLADLGFDAEWVGVRAADAGAPHARFRVFVVAVDRALADAGRVLGGAWRNAAPGQAAGWRASADARGSGGARAADALNLFPSPRASDGEKGGPNQRGSKGDLTINSAVHLLPTVTTQDGANTGGASQYDRNTLPLNTEVTLLPTPNALNSNDGERFATWQARRDFHASKAEGATRAGMPLAIATQLLPTPTVGIAEGGNATRSGARSDEKLLPGIVQDDLTKPGTTSSVADYTALWDSLEDQSPFWRTVDGKDYWPSIERWSEVLGRRAPSPTLPDGKGGRHRLNARLAEWMMGQPDGHITAPAIGLTRNEQLKACGNGVVTQQAYLATSIAWSRLADVLAVAA